LTQLVNLKFIKKTSHRKVVLHHTLRVVGGRRGDNCDFCPPLVTPLLVSSSAAGWRSDCWPENGLFQEFGGTLGRSGALDSAGNSNSQAKNSQSWKLERAAKSHEVLWGHQTREAEGRNSGFFLVRAFQNTNNVTTPL
jgi:hypothetical protein